jgi:uncharacterized protein (DUF488 family)
VAFNVFFNVVENEELRIKGIPWLCDKCHREDEVMLRIKVDYETLVICKKCLMGAKRLITDREKELKNENRGDK